MSASRINPAKIKRACGERGTVTLLDGCLELVVIAMHLGLFPTFMVCTTLFVVVSMTLTLLLPRFVMQALEQYAAMAVKNAKKSKSFLIFILCEI